MSAKEVVVRVLPAIRDIAGEAWDACANPTPISAEDRGLQRGPVAASHTSDPQPPHEHRGKGARANASFSPVRGYNPFISHAFLGALEESGSVTARTGWQPQHLLAQTREGTVVGAVPCYLKSHSLGEY